MELDGVLKDLTRPPKTNQPKKQKQKRFCEIGRPETTGGRQLRGFGQLRSFRAAPRSNSETPMQIAARLGHVAVIETDNPPTQLEESAKRSLAKRKRRNESWDAVEGEKIVTDEVLTSRPDILSEVEFTKDIEIKVGTQKMLLPVAAVQDVLKSKMREMVEEARAKHG
ncbi:hypothetical protein BSKO_04832 [Bryopsis sp. KO-2023]|nr:hypothetical protein BSKO_04832 [Bryopsis sp. KO-2023]